MLSSLLAYKKYAPIILLVIFFTALFSFHSLFRHLRYHSHAFDLGIYTQIIFLYSKNLSLFSSLKHMTLLADHFGAILLLLSPIYKLFPSANTLLIIQAIFASISAFPIYQIAQNKLKSLYLSLLITLVYLTSIGITSAVNFDFHLTTISVLPLSLMLYSWYFKKWKFYWVILLLSIIFKEDIPLFIIGLGLFQLLNKQYKIGVYTSIAGIISFLTIKFFIMPFLWPGAEKAYIGTSVLPLDSPIDLVALALIRPKIFLDQMINSPIKIATFDLLYKQFAYLPLLSPLSWLTAIPDLFLRFSSTYNATWTTNYHHNANIEPFLAVSSIFAISRFKLPHTPVILLLTFFLLMSGLNLSSIVWEPLQVNFSEINNFDYINKPISYLPESAAISAQSPIVPHIANREKIYLFPEISDADFIILDTKLETYPLNYGGFKKQIENIKLSPRWKLYYTQKSLLIFKKI